MSWTRRSISMLVGNKDGEVIVPMASKSLGLGHNAICQHLVFLLLCYSAVMAHNLSLWKVSWSNIQVLNRTPKSSRPGRLFSPSCARSGFLRILGAAPVTYGGGNQDTVFAVMSRWVY